MTISKTCLRVPMAALLALLILGACNSKTEEPELSYTPGGNVAVTSFSLKANNEVAPKLDSVFFAIDLRAGVIFNADSLPVGTDVSKIVPVVKYPSTVGNVTFRSGDNSFDYMADPSAEIDFTSPVELTLTSEDGTTSRTYFVKVNVHQQNPAQLLWSSSSLSTLPATAEEPLAQKTLKFNDETLCYVSQADGSLTMSRTSEPDGSWSSSTITLSFTPNLRTLVAADSRLFMLSDSGELMESSDGEDWSSCAETWEVITAPYLNGVTGIRKENDKNIHTSWGIGNLAEQEVSPEFPLSGFTEAATVTTDWSPWPTVFIYGGRKADGSLSNSAWGFDGDRWNVISTGLTPALEGAMLVPYWLSRPTTTMWLTDDRNAWLLIGGLKEDGTFNREVWYSFDNGVNWKSGGENMTQPEDMPGFKGSDAVVSLKPRSASAEDWKEVYIRIRPVIEGTTILWECPEIFIFGGETAEGRTANTVWRAALARYTFTPII